MMMMKMMMNQNNQIQNLKKYKNHQIKKMLIKIKNLLKIKIRSHKINVMKNKLISQKYRSNQKKYLKKMFRKIKKYQAKGPEIKKMMIVMTKVKNQIKIKRILRKKMKMMMIKRNVSQVKTKKNWTLMFKRNKKLNYKNNQEHKDLKIEN